MSLCFGKYCHFSLPQTPNCQLLSTLNSGLCPHSPLKGSLIKSPVTSSFLNSEVFPSPLRSSEFNTPMLSLDLELPSWAPPTSRLPGLAPTSQSAPSCSPPAALPATQCCRLSFRLHSFPSIPTSTGCQVITNLFL